MRWTMKVKINIFSNIGGEQRTFRTHGELSASKGGFRVSYRLDGDDCLMEYDGARAVQRRSGNMTYVISFCEGERTECVLSEGGRSFSFPVLTKTLGASFSREGCSLSLAYVQGDEGEVAEMLFVAERWRERDEKRLPRTR